MAPPPRRLVIGIGNPSRGDDALGPMCIERIAAMQLPEVELVSDFQLQVEYVLDLKDREEVIFVDASVAAVAPYHVGPVAAAKDHSYTSHALSPQALLEAYGRHFGDAPPPSLLMAIRGYGFELGEDLSPEAALNLDAAIAWLRQRLGDVA